MFWGWVWPELVESSGSSVRMLSAILVLGAVHIDPDQNIVRTVRADPACVNSGAEIMLSAPELTGASATRGQGHAFGTRIGTGAPHDRQTRVLEDKAPLGQDSVLLN